MPTTTYLGLDYPTPLDPATADLWGDIINDVIIAFDGEFGVRTIDQDYNSKVQYRPKLKTYTEKLSTLTSSSGTATIDMSNGNHFEITLTENTTIAFSNVPAADAAPVLLYVKQHASSAKTLSFPASVKWPSAVTPTMTTTLGYTDVYMFITRNGGTSYIGSTVGQAYNI